MMGAKGERISTELALGMESGIIVDSQITASSAYNQQSVGPQNARYVLRPQRMISQEIKRGQATNVCFSYEMGNPMIRPML